MEKIHFPLDASACLGLIDVTINGGYGVFNNSLITIPVVMIQKK